MLDWLYENTESSCVVCRHVGSGAIIARRADRPEPLDVVACARCDSLTIRGAHGDPPMSDDEVDAYVAYAAGVDALLRNLFRTPDVAVRSMLDIGCGYGFTVAYAAHVLGWEAIGVDPGHAARRGAAELGVDIRAGEFTATSEFGRTFDLVVASEVIEHVQSPLELLESARRLLAPGGRLVLTTPDAACVTPHRARAAEQAVEVGPHLSLLSASALADLLREAGFASALVTVDGDSLVAVAAAESGVDLSVEPTDPSAAELDEFFAVLGRSAAPRSALDLAMRLRRFTTAVYGARWSEVDDLEAGVARAFLDRNAADLTDPESVDPSSDPGTVLVVAHAAALSRLARGIEPARARAYLDLAQRAGAALDAHPFVDAGSAALLESTARHRLLAVARSEPESVPAMVGELIDEIGASAAEEWVARAFSELALAGRIDVARNIAARAQLALPGLPQTAHGVRVALDTARGLALVAMDSDERWSAQCWIGFEEDLLAERGSGVLSPEETVARRSALAELRVTSLGLADSVVGGTSPTVVPTDELLLWGSFPPTAKKNGISVVLALYNGVDYVRGALDSIAQQTTAPLEVIVVDDGSTDGSAALVQSISMPVPIRLIRKGNGGQSSARNVGIRAARGDYVAFIDQDDEWRPTHLEVLFREIKREPELAWVFADFDAVDYAGRTIVRHFVAETRVLHPRHSIADILSTDLMALPSASLMRREALHQVQGFDRRLIGYEDDDLFVRLYRRGWTYRFLPASTVRYRMHMGGASASRAFLRSRIIYLETLLRAVPDDHRLGLYFSGEYIVPRFFQTSIREYTQALAFEDYDRARMIALALDRISPLEGRGRTARRRAEMWFLRRPRGFRALLGALERLPAPLRPRINAGLWLSSTSVIRAGRFERD